MVRIEFSLRQSLVLLGLLAAVWLVVKIWSVLVLVALALLLAGALMPFVDALWRRTHRRTLAVAIVALAVLLGLAVLLLAVAPTLVAQGRDLWERWPQLQERAAAHAGAQGWTDLRDRIAAFSPTALIGPRLFDTSRTVVTAVVEVVTVFVLAIYVLLDARRLKQFLYFSTPRSWHRHIRELLPALQRVVGGYIRGQAITSAAIFAFTGATLAILGAPNAVALAAIAALLDLIPMIGVFLMMVPVVTATLQVSLTTTILAVGLMLVYQQVEDRLLLPRVYGKTLRLPTLVVVLALLIGAEVMGLIGALLALPVAAGVRVVVEYVLAARDTSAQQAAREAAPDDQIFAPDTPAPTLPGRPRRRPRALTRRPGPPRGRGRASARRREPAGVAE